MLGVKKEKTSQTIRIESYVNIIRAVRAIHNKQKISYRPKKKC
jgi:hypothetical protein